MRSHCSRAKRMRDGLGLGHQLDLGGQVGAALVEAGEPGAGHALHQRLDPAVGHLEQAQDEGHGTDGVEIVGLGVVHLPVLLGAQEDVPPVRGGGFHGLHGLVAAHEQGHDHIVEDHYVPQRKQGHGGGDFLHGGGIVIGRRVHLFVLNLGGDAASGRSPPTADGRFLFLFDVVGIKGHGCILKGRTVLRTCRFRSIRPLVCCNKPRRRR